MSAKIILPQEDVDKLIDLYVNRGLSQEKVLAESKIGISRDVLKRILTENGVKLRTMSESLKLSDGKPAGKYEIKKFETRKYIVNDDYNFNSHNGGWLLGFISADGYLPISSRAHNKIIITLSNKDKEILELIKQEIGYTGEIIDFQNSYGTISSSLSFTSKIIRKKLEDIYGIYNNKTFILNNFNCVPDDYKLDYIRGYIDGDGCIIEPQGKKLNIGLCGANKEHLKNIANYLHVNYHLSMPTIHEDCRHQHINYRIMYYVHDSLILGELMYNNEFLALPRKKQHFLDIKKKYNIDKINIPTSPDTQQG